MIVREGVKTCGRLWGFDPLYFLNKKSPFAQGAFFSVLGKKEVNLILYSMIVRKHAEPSCS